MEMWTQETCAKFQLDFTLPLELRLSTFEHTCLVCVHSIKCGHDGEVDIMPCGHPIPKEHSFPTPK